MWVEGSRAAVAVRRFVAYTALTVGAVAMSLPFVWLLSTSVKEAREIFVYPPRWVPLLPAAVERSPYPGLDRYDPPRRPPGVPRSEWPAVLEAVEAALWARAMQTPPEGALGMAVEWAGGTKAFREAVVRGLVWEVSSRMPYEAWRGTPREVAGRLAALVRPSDLERVWDQVVRRISLSELYVDDEWLRRSAVAPETIRVIGFGGSVAGLLREGDATTLLVDHSLAPEGWVTLEFDLPPLDVAAGGLVLSLREDWSFALFDVELVTGEGRWRSASRGYLSATGWTEVSYRFDPEAEHAGQFCPLRRLRGGDPSLGEGRARLTLRIARTSRPRVVWAKLSSNYVRAFREIEFARATYNSVRIALLCIVGQVLSCSLVAYSFARLRWPGREVYFALLLSTLMLPGQVTMIPAFLIFKHLHLYDTIAPLVVPSFLGSAFNIFLLRQFLRGVPTDLEDAAKIDGCSYLGIWWRIMLPLTKPALATVGIFTFMASWNDFIGPLIYLSDRRLFTLSLTLFVHQRGVGGDYGMMMAASTLMTLPVIVLFFAGQRYFVEGITLTGMKG